MHVIYLHGFASSPGSKKANFFRPYFEEKGATYSIPDLNVPSFEKLSFTAILAKVADTVRAIEDDDIYLIGSSLGGLTTLHFCAHYRDQEAKRIKKVALLAPAFDFAANRNKTMGEGWCQKWRDAGKMSFFNYARNAEADVHFGFVEDVLQYDSWRAIVDIPILIYHGKNDETVDYEQSIRFAKNHDHVTLNLLDSDHQLLDKTEEILQGIMDFFGL